jgi:predicted house-cleaning noncanonical NTP pyrophosphatase (MazG superfamily)
MEEFNELRQHIESGRYQDALALLDEMEEMSRDDKINKISSLMEVLLIHLIKQAAEKRTTRSWDVTIRNSLRQIVRTNRRRKAGGSYLTDEELLETLEGAYESALDNASLEAFEGKHTTEEIASMINRSDIIQLALEKIQQQADS